MSYGPVLYIVAELANGADRPCGLEFNWTSRAFTSLPEAQQEEADAHSAGKINERVFEFRLARHLTAVNN